MALSVMLRNAGKLNGKDLYGNCCSLYNRDLLSYRARKSCPIFTREDIDHKDYYFCRKFEDFSKNE